MILRIMCWVNLRLSPRGDKVYDVVNDSIQLYRWSPVRRNHNKCYENASWLEVNRLFRDSNNKVSGIALFPKRHSYELSNVFFVTLYDCDWEAYRMIVEWYVPILNVCLQRIHCTLRRNSVLIRRMNTSSSQVLLIIITISDRWLKQDQWSRRM